MEPPTVHVLNQTLQAVTDKSGKLPPEDRRRLLGTARKLVSTLEEPEESAFRQIFESHTYSFAVRLGVDVGVFRILVSRNGKPISAVDLAAECNIDELLLVRVMRIITGLEYAAESAESEYVATPLSHAMVIPHIEAFAVHSHEHGARVLVRMPEYLRKTGYKTPTNDNDGPFQYALHTNLAYFDYMHADPVRAERFNICMRGNKGKRRQWFEWFPMESLLDRFTVIPGSIFLVDMGGGKGHHLERLLARFPLLGNHLALQDLPGTISSLGNLDSRIRPMAHDIFSPQPVKGACVYYTHFVLHDFTDDRCRTLLRETAAAMVPGYSRLLLNEVVIPEKDCPLFFAAADITMMAVLAGIQRSRKHWIELVASAGLKVVKVWGSPDPGDMEGVIEAEAAV